MEPQIQYAKTEDGVNIAYRTMGDGTPLVRIPSLPWGLLQISAQVPEFELETSRLSRHHTLIDFDPRGFGLSDRVSEFSLDALMQDLAAPIKRLGLRKVALVAGAFGSLAAIAYAAKHSETVSHLVLMTPLIRGSEAWKLPRIAALSAMREMDWETYTEAVARLLFEVHPQNARQVAKLLQEGGTESALRAFVDAARDMDVSDLLGQVTSPTLIVRFRDSPVASEPSRDLITKLSDMRVAILPGESRSSSFEEYASAIDEFLGDDGQTTPAQAVDLPQGTALILFLDIADSTALTTKLGDAAYREKERALDGKLRAAITEAGGTPVEGKVLGDGIMSVFSSARQAIDAAQRCRDLGNEAGLPLHLGIHAGDVVREGNNVHGGAVQVAARVVDAAEPGEVLVSQTVRDLARTSADVAFEDRGEHELKGIDEPQRLFAVRSGGSPKETVD